MRHVSGVVGLGALLLLTGCNGTTKWGGIFRNNQPHAAAPDVPPPTAAALVEHLNRNSRQIQTIEVQDLDLDAKQGMTPVGLRGKMVCSKPRYFRLGASVLGNQAVDLGSNDHEFWFWISKADPPYLFHCNYADFARGTARMPFPFQPEWIMEALGMAEYGPPENYHLKVNRDTLELVQHTTSPQGQPLVKVTVFRRDRTGQVTDHLLLDGQTNKAICSAHVSSVQQVGGVVIPRQITLSWLAEKIELKMKLDDVAVNRQLDQQRMALLFTRPTLPGVQSYDLAIGRDQPTGVRRAGGFAR